MGARLQGRVRSRHGSSRSHRPMAEINVTPFVDVMLVLLIVFMVTAPLLTAGITVDLPETEAKAITKQDRTPVEIFIDRGADLYLGETKVNPARLRALLAAIAEEDAKRRVYIKADRNLSYGEVMKVMAIVNVAGLQHVALISDPAAQQSRR